MSVFLKIRDMLKSNVERVMVIQSKVLQPIDFFQTFM